MSTLSRAIEIAFLAHKGQKDKAGEEYILHSLRVMGWGKTEIEDYDKFIDRVLQNPIAIRVKINDLLDNMDITRLVELNESDLKRLNKYLKAYWKLKKHRV